MASPEDISEQDSHLWKDKDNRDIVVILKDNVRLRGTAYLVHNQRLLDLVNTSEQLFLPLTNVTVRNDETGQTIETDFVAVNIAEILLVTQYAPEIEDALDGTRWSK